MKYIVEELVLNNKGEEIDGIAFDIDLAKELKKDSKDQLLPLFIAEKIIQENILFLLEGKDYGDLYGDLWH